MIVSCIVGAVGNPLHISISVKAWCRQRSSTNALSIAMKPFSIRKAQRNDVKGDSLCTSLWRHIPLVAWAFVNCFWFSPPTVLYYSVTTRDSGSIHQTWTFCSLQIHRKEEDDIRIVNCWLIFEYKCKRHRGWQLTQAAHMVYIRSLFHWDKFFLSRILALQESS